MDDDSPIIYGLEFQARALTPVLGETEVIQFLVGTQSLKCDNQIHKIEFDEENNTINKTVFLHREGEIWDIKASPVLPHIVTTCYNKVNNNKCEIQCAIWKIPKQYDSTTMNSEDNSPIFPSLELKSKIPITEYGNEIKRFFWQPGDGQQAITLLDNNVLLWDIQESGHNSKLIGRCGLDAKSHFKFTSASWNPHNNFTQIATTNDTSIRGWDLRSLQQTYIIENAHGTLVRDINFNPNKQYYLASCGDDCKTKFWDTRNGKAPLKTLSDHSHWVWCVRYNHFHDQLLLTSSSDSRVILSNVVSLSSEPFGHLLEETNGDENEENRDRTQLIPDSVIAVYEEHEDSVYAVEWSSADPWLFASLSYDGRLVINRVPKSEKYKILL